MTKFERLTITIALLALFVSIATATKTFLFNIVGTSSATVSIQRETPISWAFGYFEVSPYFQLVNDGVAEMRPNRIELTLKMESGETIALSAENYVPSIAATNQQASQELRLSDTNLEPGKILPGTLRLRETLTLAQRDELEELDAAVFTSAQNNFNTRKSKHDQLLRKFIDKLFQGAGNLDPLLLAEFFPGGTNATPAEPDEHLKEKALALFRKSASRFKRGEHKSHVKVFDYSGRILSSKDYRVTIFDRDVKALENSHVGVLNVGPGGSRSYFPTPVQRPLLILKDA